MARPAWPSLPGPTCPDCLTNHARSGQPAGMALRTALPPLNLTGLRCVPRPGYPICWNCVAYYARGTPFAGIALRTTSGAPHLLELRFRATPARPNPRARPPYLLGFRCVPRLGWQICWDCAAYLVREVKSADSVVREAKPADSGRRPWPRLGISHERRQQRLRKHALI